MMKDISARNIKNQRFAVRGSLLIEAIVVLMLISAITPILYKHVSDRRQDVENINEANTLLMLQRDTTAFIKENFSQIITQGNACAGNCLATTYGIEASGYRTFLPSSISSNFGASMDNRYIIGMRRHTVNGNEKINALIVELKTDSSDMRAGKVATLVGASAGILSGVAPEYAWGLNGVWSESLADYFGPTNAPLLPRGTVVVSTAHEQEYPKLYLSKLEVDSDLNMAGSDISNVGTLGASRVETTNIVMPKDSKISLGAGGQICFRMNVDEYNPTTGLTETVEKEQCVYNWQGMEGSNACTEDADCPVGYTCSEEKVCVVPEPSDVDLIESCNAGNYTSCQVAYTKGLILSCATIGAAYAAEERTALTGSFNVSKVQTGNYNGVIAKRCCFGSDALSAGSTVLNVTGITSSTAATYFTVNCAGTYNIVVKGQGNTSMKGAIISARKSYLGGENWTVSKVGLYDVAVTFDDGVHSPPSLVAGSGGRVSSLGGSGISGGGGVSRGYQYGSLWEDYYCGYNYLSQENCNDTGYTSASTGNAQGGTCTSSSSYTCGDGTCWSASAANGGTGTTVAACTNAGFTNCTITPGGNCNGGYTSPGNATSGSVLITYVGE